MVNKENVQKWVDALRSGEFEQTQGRLHLTEEKKMGSRTFPAGHCCLGVVCEISDVVKSRTVRRGVENYDSNDSDLPPNVMRWLGFRTTDPHVKTEKGWQSLMELNDSGMSFHDISDLIQKTYL